MRIQAALGGGSLSPLSGPPARLPPLLQGLLFSVLWRLGQDYMAKQ